MSSVRYVDAVNGPYTTILAAVADAVAGDTILIAPGSYSGISLTKRVHIKGDTDDPINNPVTLTVDLASGNAWALRLDTINSSEEGDLIIEGIRFASSSSPQIYFAWDGLPTGIHLQINRCVFAGGSVNYPFASKSGVAVHATLTQITGGTAYVNCVGYYMNGTTAHRIALQYAQLAADPVWWGITSAVDPWTWTEYSENYVKTPTADYGAGYGHWLLTDVPYHIAGTVTLDPGDEPSDVELFLFREHATIPGRFEARPFAVTNPNASGDWEFANLPADRRFAVLCNPPETYEARVLRWYDPVAG